MGINDIQKRRDEMPTGSGDSREIFLKDGDNAFMIPVGTGDDGDPYLADFEMYNYQVGTGWGNVLVDPDVDASGVPDGIKPRAKWGLWGYCLDVLHSDKRKDEWTEMTDRAGRTVFREKVNDFRFITMGFGQSSVYWNMLVGIYMNGSLNNNVISFSRTGKGMNDTSYNVIKTEREDTIPEEKLAEIEAGDVPSVRGFLKERYGNNTVLPETASISTEEVESLPW